MQNPTTVFARRSLGAIFSLGRSLAAGSTAAVDNRFAGQRRLPIALEMANGRRHTPARRSRLVLPPSPPPPMTTLWRLAGSPISASC
jgi:hypothetical protein